MREYDLIADWYAANRRGPIGVPEVTALAAALPKDAAVLDVGCGTGFPLTQVLIDAGCRVVALDSSEDMLKIFRRNFPDVPTVHVPVQDYEPSDTLFDGAHAWGVLFHLSHDEQRRAIARLTSILKPDGLLLFTSADVHGSKQGEPMNGVPFHYSSFTIDGYRALLNDNGLTLENVHKDEGDNCYYLARKRSGAGPSYPSR